MAGLGKGLKALAGSVTPPKKDINPLLKQMEEAFTTPDPAPFGEGSEFETEVVGRFYSPVYSAIEKMPIGKEGTKGENIMGYLNKRAPNVDKSELESFNINLEPNKKYTREEVLALAREKGSPDYTIEKFKVSEYNDTQRQNISDKEVDYVELILQGKQNYTRRSGRTHFGGKKNIGHSRVSIRQEMPEGGPLSQKIVDRPRYLLIEELQSDLSKVRDDLPNDSPINTFYDQGSPFDPDIDIEQFNRQVFYPRVSENFDDLVDELSMDFNIYVDRNVVNTIKSFYLSTFDPELIDDIDAFKKIREDDTYKNLLIKQLKDEHNIDAAGRDIETVALDAIRKKSDTSSGETDWSSDGEYEYSPDEVLEKEIKRALQDTKNFIDNAYLSGAPKEQLNLEEIQTLPVATRSEYVKRLLLANIAYAKQNGINKIVIPNYKEIARQRTGDLEWVMYERPENDPLRKKYEQSLKEGTTDKLAQEYYEDVFKPIYEDAVKKVLNGLKKETKGDIKTKTKELKYPDLTEPDRFRKSNALEIDITEFEYDPETSIFRFAEGGAVPMEEQMKLFNDGGLKDEGGMVDEVSGNDVPIGSTRKEVRDDIPAMLSEGEFVFPADVVRFLGLERLMNLRQEAKMGLKQMEAMGQMGNSDEATIPDDLPFGMADLIIVGEEAENGPKEMAEGGVVTKLNNGGYLPKFVTEGNIYDDGSLAPKNTTPVEPTFTDFTPDVRRYVNENGDIRLIPFGPDGNPLVPIPVGFYPEGELPTSDTTTETTETTEAIPTSTNDDPPKVEPSEFQKAGGWNMDTSGSDGKNLQKWIDEANKLSTQGNIAAGIMGAINPLMGGMVALANKNQKKKILSMLDEKIAQARKTPIEGQVAALTEIKDRLTNPERKNILAKVVDEITGTIGDALGLSKEEKNAAKVGAQVATTTNTEESDSDTENKGTIAATNGGQTNNTTALAEALQSAESAEIAGSKLKADGTYDISSWFTDKSDTTDLEALSQATTEGYDRTSQPLPLPDVPEISDDPTIESTSVLGSEPTIPATMGIQPAEFSTLFRSSPPDESETSNLGMRTGAKVSEAGMLKLTTALDELRDSVPYHGIVSGMTLQDKMENPLAPFEIGYEKLTEAISNITNTDYTPPTQPTPTTVVTPSNDDDSPSFSSVGDNATAAQEASQNVTTTVEKDESGNVTNVTTTGGTAEERQTMQDYVTSAAAGARGGLFTRRKNKK